MATEFKDAWKKVSLPLQSDLETMMRNSNLEVMHQKKIVRQASEKTKKPRQSNRRVRLVNVHVSNLLTGTK
jgi:hypothetical protein